MKGDPRVSLKANKGRAGSLLRKVNNKQDMGDELIISFCLQVIDAITSTGNEVSVIITRVTLDDY